MKTILIIATSMLFLALAGGPVMKSQAAVSAPLLEDQIVSSTTELMGTWYSGPGGLMIRFDGNGNAALGLDSSGAPIGYAADAWFEGKQLSIAFRDFSGESGACQTAVGVYEVHELESGSLRFTPINDPCAMRSNILSGSADQGFDLVFQAVHQVIDAP